MRAGAAHDCDHQWRARKPVALEIDLVGACIGTVGAKCGSDRFSGGGSGITFEQDEPPGASLPWSGTREATLRSVSISDGVGPGPASSIGLTERRVLSSSRASGIVGL